LIQLSLFSKGYEDTLPRVGFVESK